MYELYEVRGEVRTIGLSMEQQGPFWRINLHVEHRQARSAKRALLQRVDHWTIRLDDDVMSRSDVDEALAVAILQRRIPGID